MVALIEAPVSVIIPCYQCNCTIERAVASVAAQTLKPIEVILIDDCSGGDTLQLLYEIQSNYAKNWIKVIALPENIGAGMARNIGWEISTQPYIAFLDSDDSWHPEKVKIQYVWMVKHPEVALSAHACKQLIDESIVDNRVKKITSEKKFHVVTKQQILLSNRFPTRSVMLRGNITHRFPESKRYGEDYHLWTEICCEGLKCYYSKAVLAYLYKPAYGEAGLSAALWQMEKGEINTYLSLYRAESIRFGALLFLLGLSLLKFLRRIVILSCKRGYRAGVQAYPKFKAN